MTDSILLIHGDADRLRAVGQHFEKLGYEVARELDATAGLAMHDRLRPDVVITDLDTADPDRTGAVRHFLHQSTSLVLLHAVDADDATSWLNAGCEYVLPKDVDLDRLAASVARATARARVRRTGRLLQSVGATRGGLESLGSAAPMRDIGQQVSALAQSDRAMVLLTGPRGAGKGWAARLIHDLGPRGADPCLVLECSGHEPAELDGLLFGHERGAAPGAQSRRIGMFEAASGGTLVLRSVATLPLELQPKLLRALESRSFRRLGGTRDLTADTRVIVCTDVDLAEEVEAGRFRGDLYYRLSVLALAIPSVAERAEEDRLSLITRVYAAVRPGLTGAPPAIAVETLERLLNYGWPGNVREIRNVLERAAILAQGQPTINVEHLPGEFRARPGLGDRRHSPMSLDELERGHIERTVRYHGGNRTRSARELGISRATLINKIKRYQLDE